MIFNTDFKDIIFQLTPHFLRKDNFLRYIFAGIKPLKELNNNGVIVDSFGQSDRINPSTIALDYDSTITYIIGEFRKHLSVTYQCNTDILAPESFDGSKWTRISNVNASFHQFVLFIKNFLNFDARTIYLEKYLNDVYDSVQKRIKIVNSVIIPVLYLFNKIEEREDVFFYNAWDSGFAYKLNTLPETGDFSVFENKVYQAKTDNTNKQPDLNPTDWDFIKEITFLFNFADEFPFDYRIEIPLVVTLQPDYSDNRIKSQINFFNAAGRTYEGVEKEDITNQFFNSNE